MILKNFVFKQISQNHFFFKKRLTFFKVFTFNKITLFLNKLSPLLSSSNFYKNISNIIYYYSVDSALSIFNKNYLLRLTPGILIKFFKISSKSFKKNLTVFKKFIELSIVMCNNYYINILHKPFNLRVYLLPLTKRILFNNYSLDFFIRRKKNRRVKKWLAKDYFLQNKKIY
jgi:hypothetical protein